MTSLIKNRVFITPRARKTAKELNVSADQVVGSGPNGRIIEQDILSLYEDNGETSEFSLSRITPLAKKMVEKENLQLTEITGTGIGGKVTKKDVIKQLQGTKEIDQKVVPLTGIRKVIATRMTESKRNAPHVTLTVKTEATQFVDYRNKINNTYVDTKISYTDLLVKAVAISLRKHPNINVSLEKNNISYHDDINIGIAVDIDDGLIVPIINNPDRLTIKEISSQANEKVNRARNGKLVPQDLESGRFTISNLGMFEVDAFTPVINPPESAILGIGRIIEDIIVKNKQISIGQTMVLSLSFDHRVIDGAPAARFLEAIKKLIENPEDIM